jgi:3-phosphoshikimate 1-carboxyvinyltransferase
MPSRTISAHRGVRIGGNVTVPGDKSIAHRVLILGSLARQTTFVRNVPDCADIASTLRCLEQLGISWQRVGDAVSVVGLGRQRYARPAAALDCGGSATTMRLLMGAVAGRGDVTTFTGDKTLQRRPMDRLLIPLQRMGVSYTCHGVPGYAPVTLSPPDHLTAITYELPVASAQVKTALILAGLAASGRTILTGKLNSRDHTERFVPRMGGALVATTDAVVIEPSHLEAVATTIPGDASTAAFFAAAASLLPNSSLTLTGVGINPTRMGFFEALSWMGGDVTFTEAHETDREPVGTITVRYAPLKGIEIHRDAIPFLVDEVPLIMLLACHASGNTVLQGTAELHVKESDRIGCAVEGLTRMGANIEVSEEHILIRGVGQLHGTQLDPWHDHRMSMMFTVAAHASVGESVIAGVECESKSCPTFYSLFESLLS